MKIRRLIVAVLVLAGAALATYLTWRNSLVATGAQVTRHKDQLAFFRREGAGFNIYLKDTTSDASDAVTQLTLNGRVYGALWSADGESLLMNGQDPRSKGTYWSLNVSTGALTTLETAPAPPDLLAPNGGQRIVLGKLGPCADYEFSNPAAGDFSIADSDGSHSSALISGCWPIWSPDGSQIAFSAQLEGDADREIYVMNADGGNNHRLLINPGFDTIPDWSPNGQQLDFVAISPSNVPRPRHLFVVDADGQNLRNFGPINDEQMLGPARWSPDGQWIVFTEDDYGRLCFVRPDGSARNCPDEGYRPSWSNDGSSVAFYQMLGFKRPADQICIARPQEAFHCFADTAGGQAPKWRPGS